MFTKDHKMLIMITIIMVALVGVFLFFGIPEDGYEYFLKSRSIKLLHVILVGSAISISSIIFQTICNNRILTPSIIGFDSLYQMICVLIVIGMQMTAIQTIPNIIVMFILSLIVMIGFSKILYKVLFRSSAKNIYFILLGGIVCNTLFRSISSFITRVVDYDTYISIQVKSTTNFSITSEELIPISIFLILGCICLLYPILESLDVYQLGQDTASILGVDKDVLQKKVLMIISILVSVSTILVGPITFLGLFSTNLTYYLIDSYKHKFTLIVSMMVSIILLLIGLIMIDRVLLFDTNIAIVINFFGSIYFLYLILSGGIHDRIV